MAVADVFLANKTLTHIDMSENKSYNEYSAISAARSDPCIYAIPYKQLPKVRESAMELFGEAFPRNTIEVMCLVITDIGNGRYQ